MSGAGGRNLLAWLPEACFAEGRLLDFAFAEAPLEGMSMGYCRPGLAFIAALGLTIACKPQPSDAAGAAAFAAPAAASIKGSAERIGRPAFHRHRTQSFYCYPKNYWWFYRPYTTGLDGHPRCMPYFHERPGGGRGPRSSERYVK